MKLFGAAHFRASLKAFVLGRAVQGVLAFSLLLLTVRVTASTEYGLYLVLLGLVDVVRPVSSLGVLPTVQQFLPEMALHARPAQLARFLAWARTVRWLILLLVCGGVYLGWNALCDLLDVGAGARSMALLACVLVATTLAMEYAEAALEAVLEQRLAQRVRVIYTFCRLLGVIALAMFSVPDAKGLVVVDCLAASLCLILAERYCTARSRLLEPDGSKDFHWREIAHYALHLSFSQLMSAAATPGAVRLVVARTLGLDAIAHFGFLQLLIGQINRFLPSLLLINLVRPALIAARLRGKVDIVADACGFLFKSNLLIVWPGIGLAVLCGDWLVAQMSGHKFENLGLELAVMLLALASMTQTQMTVIVFQIHRMSAALGRLSAIALSTPLLALAGAQHSLLGALVGLTLATMLRNAVSMWVLQRSLARVTVDVAGILRVLALLVLSGALGALAAYRFGEVAGVALYVALLAPGIALVRPVHEREFAVLQAVTKRPLSWMKLLVRRAAPEG
ncbi:MAG: hypothetical protein EOP38_03560 [Rubrivivax sp.]|nr:MAG: hypothetical protein EOP38_03560 [Rubrivivax sp.]